jgi:hypothetical protein
LLSDAHRRSLSPKNLACLQRNLYLKARRHAWLLSTGYGDTWLGNPAFRPVMEELNRRKAVVHVHPTAANCCRNLDYGVAPGSIEYGTDTTRAIIGVTFSGDAARFPGIRFIWSHAGGSAPFLAGRIEGAAGTAKLRTVFEYCPRVPSQGTHGVKPCSAPSMTIFLIPARRALEDDLRFLPHVAEPLAVLEARVGGALISSGGAFKGPR